MCGILFSPSIQLQGTFEVREPKSSAGEITIVTPENKTYTEPDSGYYPATYGFENDFPGSYPESFIILEPSSTEIQVESEIGGHKNVISLRDWSDSVESAATTTFETPQEFGTIEWWFRAAGTSSYRNHDVRIGSGNINGASGNTNGVINIMFGDGFFYIRNGTDNNVGSYISNRWYHIRLTFDCSLGGYDGNGQYQATFYIDGENKGTWDFWNIKTTIEKLSIETYGWSCRTNEKTYYDALGFSWDPNYSIGDNLNEGLLLSYDSTTTLDWQVFSLDGQANNTILGNTTIPMPADGLHKVQVFGNDSVGTMYESDLRYFTIATNPPEITINSPTPSQTIGSTPPNYNISITGPYDSMWYTLDGGATNLTANSLTGTINQAVWTALLDGIITITFFANNSAGMEGSAQVMVIKQISSEPPPGIPGYNFLALLGVTLAVSLILAKRKLKK